ncbi:MAG: sigma-70 family RNA polymerase sigma factor [Chloroflexi bacterium]|nr:sigma-70 family RNA polymerase sigma factor [Chloroflexota bacterium]MBV9898866.1 sigma-70 family RNA polymerase sigma factor [Chloroflexota bacterium]
MRTAEAPPLAETRRDPVAVEEAFATHYSAVFRQVQRLMRDPDDSYDLTLTAWEKAQRAWDRRPMVAVEIKPWLFRIARNACVDELRRRQLVRWEPLEGTRRSGTGETTSIVPAALLSSDSHDPEREVLRSERADLVRKALRRLPNRYRTCLLMREAEGLSCEEIGSRLQLSSGAVRTTLCRARQRLRSEYVALGGEAA